MKMAETRTAQLVHAGKQSTQPPESTRNWLARVTTTMERDGKITGRAIQRREQTLRQAESADNS